MANVKDPHKRLHRDMLSNNIAGLANVYCFNHIEGPYIPEKDRLTQSEVDAVMEYLGEHENYTAQFVNHLINFRALTELTFLVGLAHREYELALHKLILINAWRFQNSTPVEVPFSEDVFVEIYQEEETLTRHAAVQCQRQFVGIMGGVKSLCTTRNKMAYFIPHSWKNVFTAYTEGRDVTRERVVNHYNKLSVWLEEVAKEALVRVPALKDVEVVPGFAATAVNHFNSYREMWQCKRIEDIF